MPPDTRSAPAGSEGAPGDRGDQPDLLSILQNASHPAEEGRRRRDRGIDAAAWNSWGPWRRAAWRWIVALPAGTATTSDDLVDAVGMPVASSRNALGALIRQAATAGLLEEAGYVVSRRAAARGRRILEWRRTEVRP